MYRVMPSTLGDLSESRRMISLTSDVALLARLEIDLDAAAVGRHVGSVHADKRGEANHVRILQDDASKVLAASRPCP